MLTISVAVPLSDQFSFILLLAFFLTLRGAVAGDAASFDQYTDCPETFVYGQLAVVNCTYNSTKALNRQDPHFRQGIINCSYGTMESFYFRFDGTPRFENCFAFYPVGMACTGNKDRTKDKTKFPQCNCAGKSADILIFQYLFYPELFHSGKTITCFMPCKDTVTGQDVFTSGAADTCTKIQVVCPNGKYGKFCKSCGQCAGNAYCDKVTGHCSACRTPGQASPLCQACKPRLRGPDCTDCVKPAFRPPDCAKCQPGFTGPNCTVLNAGCVPPNCDSCKPGWQFPGCDRCMPGFKPPDCAECQPGFTGPNCTVLNAGCVPPNCDSCKPGWQFPGCDRCRPGFKPPDCAECQADLHPPFCSTCRGGFLPPDCKVCRPGLEGTTCETCAKPGFQPPDCRQCKMGFLYPTCTGCAGGYYGTECVPCGRCAEQAPCDKKDGSCIACDSHQLTLPLCQVRSSRATEESGWNTGLLLALGLGLAALLLLVPLGAVCFIRRRRWNDVPGAGGQVHVVAQTGQAKQPLQEQPAVHGHQEFLQQQPTDSVIDDSASRVDASEMTSASGSETTSASASTISDHSSDTEL